MGRELHISSQWKEGVKKKEGGWGTAWRWGRDGNPRITLLGVMTSQSAALHCGESQLCGGPSV